MRPESYTIHLANFDGPLDLLLHLIRREEMNIYDIPIAKILEQYLEIIRDLATLDIDRASEFLVMAATLLGIKSRMLLPKPPIHVVEEIPLDEGADPREELVRQLVTYSQFKEVASQLRDREQEMFRVYTRHLFVEQAEGAAPLVGLNLADLVKAFRAVLVEEWNWREVPREEIPMREKIREIIFRISRSSQGVRFRDLFNHDGGSRLDMIVTFLALLELLRLQKVAVVQDGLFSDIWVRRPVLDPQPTETDDPETA
jgi:segregation and condensation protein A